MISTGIKITEFSIKHVAKTFYFNTLFSFSDAMSLLRPISNPIVNPIIIPNAGHKAIPMANLTEFPNTPVIIPIITPKHIPRVTPRPTPKVV
ncbi:hypothetical protein EM932_19185 [Flavivirga rizhaonensis]|uniref:Uncharacterized protein n=1 Tax=Flavivirga rizhaonensis TaxID=2559571 RepID=A0A4S1DRG7_9FLAO|nr:hypothetical protein EM932_19185 [Flavivirga rizhaonensis]